MRCQVLFLSWPIRNNKYVHSVSKKRITTYTFVGAFTCEKPLLFSSCPSFRLYHNDSNLADCREILRCWNFTYVCWHILTLYKIRPNKEHCTCRHAYVYGPSPWLFFIIETRLVLYDMIWGPSSEWASSIIDWKHRVSTSKRYKI